MLTLARHTAKSLTGLLVLAPLFHASFQHEEDECLDAVGYAAGSLAWKDGARPTTPRPEILPLGVCAVDNARSNLATPTKTNADFVPIYGDDSLGFYVIYGVKASTTGGIGGNVTISLFELANGEVLVFGSGYGNIAGANLFDAAYDMERVDQVIQSCMGRSPATTPLRMVVPHGHGDHVNPACNRELERLGYTITEIVYHQDDLANMNGMNWTTADKAKFVQLPRATSCLQELRSYASPLGKIWFFERPGHTPGSIDLVIDVKNDPTNRFVVRGSQASPPCAPVPGQREIINAHGNALLTTTRPTVTSLDVLGGTSLGGTPVTLTGTDFQAFGAGTPEVRFGGLPASNVVVVSGTTLTCLTPAGAPNQLVDVTVVNNNGQSSLSSAYFYNPKPVVTSITPTGGDWRGNTIIQVRGSGFFVQGVTDVWFGTKKSPAVSIKGDTLMTCRAPAGTPGTTVDLFVRNINGEGALLAAYTYAADLSLADAEPDHASPLGGTEVILTGTSFGTLPPSVTFGGEPATSVTLLGPTQVRCTVPAGAPGTTVDVVLSNGSGVATLSGFRYHATPSLVDVRPGLGRGTGGTPITLTGLGFLADSPGVNQVRFGGAPASDVVIVDDTTLTCVTPPGEGGTTVNVTLSNQNGTATLPLSFRYTRSLSLAGSTPASSSSQGGALVTLTGSGFQEGPAGTNVVRFGGVPATGVTVVDDSTLTCLAPAGSPGATVDLSVQNDNGSVTLPAAFRYHAAPTLLAVTPDHGHAGGTTSVTLTGTGFQDDEAGFALVVAGGIAAGNVNVLNDTTLICEIPPGQAGARIDLLLVTQNGNATLTQGFRYHTAPSLATVTPASGAGNNAQRVTLTGTGFLNDSAGTPTVRFGGVNASSILVLDDATLRCNVPTGKFGQAVDVVVTNARGSSTLVSGYRYHARPTIASITPDRGSFQGNTLVTINGTGFQVDGAGTNTVSFGGVAATSVTILSDGSLTCRTPAGLRDARVDVVLTNANGSATATGAFSYSVPAPTVASLTPASGPAQSPGSIEIVGTGFLANGAGTNTVSFGTLTSGIVGVIDDTRLSCQVPAGTPGTRVDVVVTNANGSATLVQGFRYHARPTLTALVPASAGAPGGSVLELQGTGFQADAPGTNRVTFDALEATGVTVLSDTRLSCIVPAGTPGASALVRVTNANGASDTSTFTYHPTPTLLTVEPPMGPALGGTSIVLSGTGFLSNAAGPNQVSIGGRSAGNVAVLSDTRIACLTPRGTGGYAEVRVTNANGTAALAQGFHYGKLPPEIASFSPASGPAAGQNIVTLEGRGFQASGAGQNRVKFGTILSPSVITLDDETVLCTVPAGTPGTNVEVALNNNNGTVVASGLYRYRSRPVITAVDPSEGPALMRTRITIHGSGFVADQAGPTTVLFDSVRAREVIVVDDTRITCMVAGGGPGAVLDVTVRNDNGSSTLPDAYRVTGGPPSIGAVQPSVGPYIGGTPITVTGSGFSSANARVRFGDQPATGVVVLDDTTLTCVSPAGTLGERVTVSVDTKYGTAALLNGYLYSSLRPNLVSLTPDHGPAAGGLSVTLVGSAFLAEGAGVTTVAFGGTPATGVVVLDDTHVTCVVPAGKGGTTVDVALTNGNGLAVLAGGFRYHRLPTLTTLTPATGRAGGGTNVTVTGSGFQADGAGVPTVRFGSTPATSVVVLSDTTLTCVTPAGTPGSSVDVRLANANGSATLTSAFRYHGVPSLTGLSPTRGPAAGGTSVTLSGSGFAADSAGPNEVRFGGVLALSVVTLNDGTITCVTPPGTAGTDVDVRVTNANGTQALPAAFRYFAPPVVTGLAPARGPAAGGTAVTISGSGFLDPDAGSNLVLFGGISALDVIELTDKEITCTTPPGASGALVDVLLVNGNGSAQLSGAFRYFTAPTLTALTPDHGPSGGGTLVTLTGTGFAELGAGTATVRFGGTPASEVTIQSDGQLTCRAPAGTPGTSAAVSLENANGTASLPLAFRYHARPALTAVAPPRGPASGGTRLTLDGSGFLLDSAGTNLVRIGGIAATEVTVLSDTRLECVAPGGPANQLLDVALANANGEATLAAAFRYVTAPTLASITPARGPGAGGNSVLLVGAGFLAPEAGSNLVLFGGVAALDVIELDDATLSCTVPPGVPGTTVDVLLANGNGQALLAAGYRYHAQPNLTALTPDHGRADGGTTVVLAGSGFLDDDAGTPSVLFGGVSATGVVVLDDGSVSCAAPAGTPGSTVDVRVSNANGESLILAGWRYHALPTLASLAPARGPAAGGTLVTVTGTGFLNDEAGTNSILIGGKFSSKVNVVSDTTLTFLTPDGHPNAVVDVRVSNQNGSATRENSFRYNPLPTLTAIAPDSGPESGGNTVTLSGSGFANFAPGANQVSFGGLAATSIVVVNDSTLTCVVPPGTGGTRVDVALANANGGDTRVQGYRYNPAPRLTAVAPGSASALGGARVTLTGSGFADPSVTSTLVTFGGLAAFNLDVLDDTRIECDVPAGPAGLAVDVAVVNDNGLAVLAGSLRYHAQPTLLAVSPTLGSSVVPTVVSLTGTGFLADAAGANTVLFGGVPATDVNVVSDTLLTCTVAPAAAGSTVSVSLSNANGAALLADAFGFDAPAPTLTGLTPASGVVSGGTPVTLTGTNLTAPGAGTTTITFGGLPATGVVVVNDTTATCASPAGTLGALVDVVLSNGNGSAQLPGAFTYSAPLPILTGLTPASGPAAGGNTVTLNGSGFQLHGAGAATVTFGGVPATGVVVLGDTALTCAVPAGTAGASVSVTVTNANGSSTLVSGYRYHARPAIASISPVSGTSLGGALVTLNGSGFLNDAAGLNTVRFGTVAGTSVTVLSDAQLRVRAPSGTPGAIVDVTVVNANGQATLVSAYRYHQRPTLTSVTPASGPAAGANRVTLTGTGFTADGASVNVVSFGGVVASGVSVLSNTTLECNVPAGTSGLQVLVTVANVNGTAMLTNGYRYHARPTLTSVTPGNGPAAGGTSVTLAGSGFLVDNAGTNAVTFGGAPATAVSASADGTLTCLTPPGTAGATVDVVLSNANGSATLFGGFTYDAAALPLVSGFSPGKGSTRGSTPVVLTGSGFVPNLTVTFGGAPATDVVVQDEHTLTLTTPEGVEGWSDVEVTSEHGTGRVLLGFQYVRPPVLESIEPPIAPPEGGTIVILNGSGFAAEGAGEPAVRFGALEALSVQVLDDAHLAVEVPAGTALSTSDVEIENEIDRTVLAGALRWQHAHPTDLDRDGRGDVLVSASGEDRVHVFHGRALPMPRRTTAESDVRASAHRRGTGFGAPVTAGDVDGDGFSDLVVGAPLDGDGAVYVFRGPLTGAMPELSTLEASTVLRGQAGLGFGRALCLYDVNRDGTLDLLASAGGSLAQVFLHLGGPAGLASEAALILTSPSSGDDFGAALAAGDLDGDGWPELVVGAPLAATGGRNAATVGAVHVYRGRAELGGEDTPWRTLLGQEAGARFGAALAIGELGQGAALDLAVGAPDSAGGAGAVHLFAGSADFAALDTGLRLSPEGTDDRLGAALSAGDVDGDGRLELLVGAPGWNGTGRAYLFRGADELAARNAGSADARLMAPLDAAGQFASAVTLVDVDGDGRQDLVITAPGDGSTAGQVYVFASGRVLAGDLVRQADGRLDARDARERLGADAPLDR